MRQEAAFGRLKVGRDGEMRRRQGSRRVAPRAAVGLLRAACPSGLFVDPVPSLLGPELWGGAQQPAHWFPLSLRIAGREIQQDRQLASGTLEAGSIIWGGIQTQTQVWW